MMMMRHKLVSLLANQKKLRKQMKTFLNFQIDFDNLYLISGALTKSQFPVFTIYAQKSCLGVRPCARAWCIDRVQNYRLEGHAKRTHAVTSRRDCLELCLGETEFTCR